MGELVTEGGQFNPEEKKFSEGEKETPKNQEASEEPKTSEEKETPEKTEEPEKAEPEKAEESKEIDVKSLLAQKEHFREKYQKAKAELDKLKSSGVQAPVDPLEVVKLAKALEGYNEEEIEFITRVAPEKSPDGILKALQDEWVKTAIEAKREKVAKEKKVPESSSPASKTGEITPEEAAKDDQKWFDYLQKQKGKGGSEL